LLIEYACDTSQISGSFDYGQHEFIVTPNK
jgi:hypothetical protein